MTDVLVFGATSLVGSHFAAHPPSGVSIATAGRTPPGSLGIAVSRFDVVDLHDPAAVEQTVRRAPEAIVVNFAARTDVDGVEKERPTVSVPDPGRSKAFQVNTLGVEAMARASSAEGKLLITISTDFVFDGRDGPYPESSLPHPLGPMVSWYGWTKGEGERRVRAALPEAAIVRIAYPYRPPYGGKTDFAGWVREKYRTGGLPPLYTDQVMSPTWVPDVTKAVSSLVLAPKSGTFHVASPTLASPHAFATGLLEAESGVRPTLAEGSLAARLREPGVTPRPLRGGLRTDRVSELGFTPTRWEDGVRALVAAGSPA